MPCSLTSSSETKNKPGIRVENEWGSCELNPFPRCSAIVVFNKAEIKPELRGKGFGSENHRRRLQRAKDMGYTYAVCTVRHENAIERAILMHNGWTHLSTFPAKYDINGPRELELWGREL